MTLSALLHWAPVALLFVIVLVGLWREYLRQTELERLERAMKERER